MQILHKQVTAAGFSLTPPQRHPPPDAGGEGGGAHSNDWTNCKFNGIAKLCSLAGGSKDFVVIYKSDGKQIRMERVGDDYSCSTGDATCGKMLITEIMERRSTWAAFRMSEGVIRVNSSRGNKYEFKY